MEAFIGSRSYGTYSTFTFTVKNECLGFGSSTLSNIWSFKGADANDPIAVFAGDTNNYYEIWHSATEKKLYLPKMQPQLPSELLNAGYQTTEQECGAFAYRILNDISSFASVTTAANGYPVVTIKTTNPSLSGQSISNSYV